MTRDTGARHRSKSYESFEGEKKDGELQRPRKKKRRETALIEIQWVAR